MAIPAQETPILPNTPSPQPKQPSDGGNITEAQREGRDWLEHNQKLVVGLVAVLVAIAAGIFLYKKFVAEPAQEAATAVMWKAQQAFDKDSFQLALQGPAVGYLGFLDIADEYSSTPAGNLADYYAGISYLHLGQYEAAIDYLEDYDEDGQILPATKANAIGDAYAQLGNLEMAEGYYEDALAKAEGNELLAPYLLKKVALLRERQGNLAGANELYTRLQNEYPNSTEAGDIAKFIARTAG